MCIGPSVNYPEPVPATTKELTIDRFRGIVSLVEFDPWSFKVAYTGEGYYLQVRDDKGTCNVTGGHMPWGGRKWRLSPHMTKSEVVQTAFKAVLTALEHEARECFLYRGKAIFGPHLDVDKLHELTQSPDCEDTRVEAA